MDKTILNIGCGKDRLKKINLKKFFLYSIYIIIFLVYPWFVLVLFQFKKTQQPPQTFNPSLKVLKNSNNPIFTASSEGRWDSNKLVAGNCFIRDTKGNLALIYYSTGTNSTVTSIGLATTRDGINFVRRDTPILTPGNGEEWDSGGVSVFPNCAVKQVDDSYTMFYIGFKKGTPDFYHSGAIGVATSSDLIHWKKYEKNPVLKPESGSAWDSLGVFEPSVYFNGNFYG